MDRSQILNEIIERELTMFLATPNEGGTASCQERPDTLPAPSGEEDFG